MDILSDFKSGVHYKSIMRKYGIGKIKKNIIFTEL